MKTLFFSLLLLPLFLLAQDPTFKEGIPNDLENEKIIFLEHEKINVIANQKKKSQRKYLELRQTNHNRVLKEANTKLKTAALNYPYGYAIASPSSYKSLAKAGYKYVLYSQAYTYEFLREQPEDNAIVVFEYFIYNIEENVAHKAFEVDELKIYDFKLLIKKLNKAIDKQKH